MDRDDLSKIFDSQVSIIAAYGAVPWQIPTLLRGQRLVALQLAASHGEENIPPFLPVIPPSMPVSQNELMEIAGIVSSMYLETYSIKDIIEVNFFPYYIFDIREGHHNDEGRRALTASEIISLMTFSPHFTQLVTSERKIILASNSRGIGHIPTCQVIPGVHFNREKVMMERFDPEIETMEMYKDRLVIPSCAWPSNSK